MKLNLNQAVRIERAFTLVEVLVAAALAAIILTSIYVGIATNFSMMDSTRQNLRATQIIVSKLEGIRLCAWKADQLFDNGTTGVLPKNFQENFFPLGLQGSTNKGIPYFGTIEVSTNPATFLAVFEATNNSPSYISKLAVVTVTLRWTNGFTTKIGHTRSMSALVSQNGIQTYVSKF